MAPGKKTAVFIMPRTSSSWSGAEALWITVASWAVVAEAQFGRAVVVTQDRIAKPREVYSYPLVQRVPNRQHPRFSWIPTFLKVLLKDLFYWVQSRNWKIIKELEESTTAMVFVWEQHDLFSGPGRKLATRHKIPLIKYVHAPVVWEASKWGVNRSLWGWWLQKREARELKRADLIAVVSEEVKQKVIEMGIPGKKVLVSPMGVDPEIFSSPDTPLVSFIQKNKLRDKMIIGWTGSFRKFHGLEFLMEAFASVSKQYSQVVLVLVGDGAERIRMESLAGILGVTEKVIFAGKREFLEVPKFVALFDLAVVSATSAEGFHYSPLKLREYMAAGKPVIAPNVGEISQCFEDGKHLRYYDAGNSESLAESISYLLENKAVRERIARQGKEHALATGSWQRSLSKALEYLNELRDEK